jgi:hypothetical protein
MLTIIYPESNTPETSQVERRPVVTAGRPSESSTANLAMVSEKSDRVRMRNREQSRNNRKRARVEFSALRQPPAISKRARAKHTGQNKAIITPMSTNNVKVARTGYISLNTLKRKGNGEGEGENDDDDEANPLEIDCSVEVLKGMGFRYEAWEGG